MKKEKTKLRVIQILCIVSLLITVFSIQRTYAKYFEKVGTTYDSNIKRWVIKIKNINIHEEDTLNNVMTPVIRANEHMNSNNTLVPGREGYFEFDLDYSSVDVAFRFQFDIEQLNTKIVTEGEGESQTQTEVDNHLEDFEIYGYSIVDNDPDSGDEVETITEIATVNDMSLLTQIINPSTDVNNNNEKKRKLRILFRWNDENADVVETDEGGEEPGMDNSEDTLYEGEEIEGNPGHTNLNYNVKVTFTQQM